MWSRYNFLFTSPTQGHILYNSLSNRFCAIEDGTIDAIKRIRDDPDNYDFGGNVPLLLQLKAGRVLLTEDEQEALLRKIRLDRLSLAFDNTTLGLTIAPTLECNFKCPYCFQEGSSSGRMDRVVEDKLIDFITGYKRVSFLYICWFGGEPLLELETIQRLTGRIEKLGIPFNAKIITNGYLLDSGTVDTLGDLRVKFIQLTIDGPEEIHNKRRVHVSGEGTYSRILAHLEYLLNHWDGVCAVRVNVDNSNREHFADVYGSLRDRFKGKRLIVYPGIVKEMGEGNPDTSCPFSKREEAIFLIDQYREHGIADVVSGAVKRRTICMAAKRNGFVIGPDGSMYKCWADIGRPDMAVGSVVEGKITNWDLASKYMIGTDCFDDPQCLKCFYLPICSGGCRNLRLRKEYLGEDVDHCINLKGRLPDFLEIMLDVMSNKRGNETAPAPQREEHLRD